MNATEELTYMPDYFEAVCTIMSVVEDLTGHRTFNEESDQKLDSILEDLKTFGLHERRLQLGWWKPDPLVERRKRLHQIQVRLKNLGSAQRPSFDYMKIFYETGKDPERRISRRPVRKKG